MSGVIATNPRYQFSSAAGVPMASGTLTVYLAGTTTPTSTWQDSALATANSNPITLDARGECVLWLDSAITYKFVLKNAAGVTQWTGDNITGAASVGMLGNFSASGGSALVGFIQSGAGAVARTAQDKMRDSVSVKDFGAVGDGVTDDTAAIQAAVDHAEVLLVAYLTPQGPGASVFFPDGSYLLTSPVTITSSGIALHGGASQGVEIKGDCVLFNIGDYTLSGRIWNVSLSNLKLSCTNTAGTTAAITLYRTVQTVSADLSIYGFNIGIDCYRSSEHFISRCLCSNLNRTAQATAFFRAQGTDETITTGDLYCPGGGVHVDNCEIRGDATSTFDTDAGFLLMSVDGFYMTQTHITGCITSLLTAPDASAANHVIIDVAVENCYFDNPSVNSADAYNAKISGTVKESITMASGATQISVYQSMRFSNNNFRGAYLVSSCFEISVTDGDTWFDSDRRLRDLIFSGNAFRQSRNACFRSISGKIEPTHLVIDGCTFAEGNSSANSSIGYAINLNADSVVISSNSISAPAGASDYAISVVSSDLGAGDNSNPTAVVTGNDLTKSVATIEPVRILQTGSEGSNTLQAHNLYPGYGRVVQERYSKTTSDATATSIWFFNVPNSVGGSVTATVTGCKSDGTKTVSYQAYVGFRNNGTATILSTGTSTWSAIRAWNPDAIATVPVFELSENIIRVRVTGVAAETWNWSCQINMVATN